MSHLKMTQFFAMTVSICVALAACAGPSHPKTPHSKTSKPFFTNDASAPLNTALCGAAAQEQISMERAIFNVPYRTGEGCVQNACFSPLTSAFISATGYRSVCR